MVASALKELVLFWHVQNQFPRSLTYRQSTTWGFVNRRFGCLHCWARTIFLSVSGRIGESEATKSGLCCAGRRAQIPLEYSSFDFVYCRFMAEYLKSPQTAISAMFRVCRTSSRAMLQDLDDQHVWHDGMEAGLSRDIRTAVSFLRETGFSPMIGRKFCASARSAGVIDLQVEAEAYDLYGARRSVE